AFVADFEARWLALVFQILGIFAYRGELKDPGPRTDCGVARYHRTWADPAVPADLYPRSDYRARADLNAGIELGAFIDRGRGMNAAGYRSFSSTSIADNSASAASSPSTRACADIFHRGRRILTALTSILTWSPGITWRRKRTLSSPASMNRVLWSGPR